MPQLDRFAFVSEVIWLIVMFLVVYFLLLKTGLPGIYKVLRYRKEKLEGIRGNVLFLERELFTLERGVKGLVLNVINKLKEVPEKVGKLIDVNIDLRKVNLKRGLDMEGDVRSLSSADEKVISELRVGRLLDETEYVKDKIALRKKVLY